MEFVKFKLADMTSEDLFAYIRDIMMNELIDLEEDELRDEMDEYDENLYEVLAPYVLDQELRMKFSKNSYTTDRRNGNTVCHFIKCLTPPTQGGFLSL